MVFQALGQVLHYLSDLIVYSNPTSLSSVLPEHFRLAPNLGPLLRQFLCFEYAPNWLEIFSQILHFIEAYLADPI